MNHALRILIVCLGVAAALLVAAIGWHKPADLLWGRYLKDSLDGIRRGYSIEYDQTIQMRDRTTLGHDLYLPRHGKTRFGTVLIRLPYGKKIYGESRRAARYFAERGFAVVIQDMRGRFASAGEFVPYTHAVEDGFDTVEWITRQPWSNTRVGTFGCSALGEIQIISAKAPHPALKAMIVRGAGGAMGSAMGRYTYFGLFDGGIFNLAAGAGWFSVHDRPASSPPRRPLDHLPSSAILGDSAGGTDNYRRLISMPMDSPEWLKMGYLQDGDRLSTPTLAFNTWYDPTVADSFATAALAGAEHRVIVGPGTHCTGDAPDEDDRVGDLEVRNQRYPYWEHYLAWFSHWLVDPTQSSSTAIPNPADLLKQPRYQLFVLGENRWISSEQWPPERSLKQRWSLASTQGANSRSGDGVLLPPDQKFPTGSYDEFTYDPRHPVPSRGGPVCCVDDPLIRAGAVDQTDVEARPDVLVYTSAPLNSPLRIVGPLSAHLTVSSSAPDTDLVARLVDVAPDGKTLNIQEGALRLRYRDGFSRPTLMEPQKQYRATIDMRATAYQLAAGHRLRLQITSSSFPRLERNLNSGGNNQEETIARIAINRIWHKSAGQSFIEFHELPN